MNNNHQADITVSRWESRTEITQNLVSGANNALRVASNLLIVLLTVCAFVLIAVLPITDKDLLRGSVSFTVLSRIMWVNTSTQAEQYISISQFKTIKMR